MANVSRKAHLSVCVIVYREYGREAVLDTLLYGDHVLCAQYT